ncbi:MAG: isoaspartyl peptidase/L-asparaginase [Propionibacteriaceae bacterium]|nr:isoaspartyl peptidase/L-asparaginase [Propionibacteriaceae bacterium]
MVVGDPRRRGGTADRRAAKSFDAYHAGLRAAFEAGEAVLAGGGSALDAVCAAVRALEDNPVFNAGRGAVLAADGRAELDASVMTGDGRAGAVTVSRWARNPVELAKAVRQHSPHVLLADPPRSLLATWDVVEAEVGWFETAPRVEQLRRLQAESAEGPRHGTVGAVALDGAGALAAATSTGGMANKANGRVGDSPIVGAGTYARDGVVAVSTTGEGEAFLAGVVAHDVYARMAYGQATLARAVEATLTAELGSRDAMGALIAVGAEGQIVVGTRSDTLLAAWRDGDEIVTRI